VIYGGFSGLIEQLNIFHCQCGSSWAVEFRKLQTGHGVDADDLKLFEPGEEQT